MLKITFQDKRIFPLIIYIHLSLVVVGVNQMLRILSQFNTSTTSITIRHLCV